jgi:hypothetical protein
MGAHEFASVLKFLIFWGVVAAIFIVPAWLRTRDRERARDALHQTLRAAYDRGQPVPAELVEALQTQVDRKVVVGSAERDLRRAIVFLAIGLGLVGLGAGLWYGISFASDIGGAVTGGIVAGTGAIPAFLGLAYLVLYLTRGGSKRS